MNCNWRHISLGCAAIGLVLPVSAQTPAAQTPVEVLQVSIKEVMVSVITPTTNTLWGVGDPASDEEWQALEDAAIAVVASGALINLGGSGPQDNTWVKDPAWRAFTQVMTNAGIDALKAIRAKDIDALLEAGNVLYPPLRGLSPAV